MFIKLLLIPNIPQHIWLGADGESYIGGLNALLTDGFFSKASTLLYWPAGYPLFMVPLAKLSLTSFTTILSLVQSLIFALATYLFTKQILLSIFKKYANLVSFLISFNPTLTLSSLVIGYESLVASLLLLASGIILRAGSNNLGKANWRTAVALSVLFSISIFLQPRTIVFAIAAVVIYIIYLNGYQAKVLTLIVCIVVTSILPTVLIYRNSIANNTMTISTNLGVTMLIGAGDNATGGYGNSGGLACEPKNAASSVTDNQKVICVLNWYLSNPSKAFKLAVNKSIYYWSPWSGPLTNGTMARNPWSKINPINSIAKNEEGNKLVYGLVGKIISWLWLLGGLSLIFSGTLWLWLLGGTERYLGLLVSAPTFLGWFISIGTIGDDRFRIPQMGFSIFMQVIGFVAITKRFKKR